MDIIYLQNYSKEAVKIIQFEKNVNSHENLRDYLLNIFQNYYIHNIDGIYENNGKFCTIKIKDVIEGEKLSIILKIKDIEQIRLFTFYLKKSKKFTMENHHKNKAKFIADKIIDFFFKE